MSPASIKGTFGDRYAVNVRDARGDLWSALMGSTAERMPTERQILDAWDFATEGGRVETAGWRRA
ncbi:MAG: hypothetical protein EKK55_02335 [Rhodocyclaceae bacterium]|nr:MAG: hypothetical protein EKK55_02335 [Rhodocyclaceae bacterium]